MTEQEITAKALRLLKKHGRYHPQMGGFYSAIIKGKIFKAKETHELREKIEEWLRGS